MAFQGQLAGFELVDWDADGELEIAGLSAGGLEVFEQDGTPAGSFAANHAGGHLAVLAREGAGQCIAWVDRDESDSHDVLRTIAADVEFAPLDLLFEPAPGLSAVAIDVEGLRSQDLDGDTHEDLILAHSSFESAVVLVNQWSVDAPDPFSAQAGAFQLVELSSQPTQPPTGGTVQPGFADVDQDGRADVLYPMEDTPRRVRVLLELSSPSGQDLPSSSSTDVLQKVEYGPDASQTIHQLHFYLRIPQAILDGPWDHAQVILWKQVGEQLVQATAVDNVLYELQTAVPAGQDPRDQRVVVDVPGEGPVPWTTQRHYYVDLRFVVAQPGTPPSTSMSTRTLLHGWTLADGSDPDYQTYGSWADYLTGQPSAGTSMAIRPAPPLAPPVGGIIIGIDVPLGRVPNHGEQEVPDPGVPDSQIRTTEYWSWQ